MRNEARQPTPQAEPPMLREVPLNREERRRMRFGGVTRVRPHAAVARGGRILDLGPSEITPWK